MSPHTSPSSQMYGSPSQSLTEDRVTPAFPQPPRKMTSTGGGRAWSEEEENYLIETRQHKMPYKHIAQHLNKTELACRLHYHQLSFGTKRRRRTSSVSSNRSVASSTHSAEAVPLAQQRPLPQLSPPASPPEHRSARSASPGGNPVPILPKPILSSNATPQPRMAAAFPPPPAAANALRLITAEPDRYGDPHRGVDRNRLARAYDAHRAQFWQGVAREYGDGASPAVLEDVWWRQCSGQLPPTPPSRSPASEKPLHGARLGPALPDLPQHAAASFRPVNQPHPVRASPPPSNPPSRSNTFKIESLLTEDKEIRSSPPIAMAY